MGLLDHDGDAVSTLDKPKRNGAAKAGATFTGRWVPDGASYVPPNSTQTVPPRRVKKGCGQRKNKRDRAGRALHALMCRIQRRYPGSNPAIVLEQLRTGQLSR